MNIYHIIIIFSVTALLGVTLLTFVLNNKPRPMALIAAKGILALTGLGTLYYFISDETMDMKHAPIASVVFLSFAALGGVYLFIRDKVMGDENYPKWMVFGHAAMAVIGYILLWVYVLTR
jgi:hypothetical protein